MLYNLRAKASHSNNNTLEKIGLKFLDSGFLRLS